jgi:hypothetical protein
VKKQGVEVNFTGVWAIHSDTNHKKGVEEEEGAAALR